jgi:amino acid transporter
MAREGSIPFSATLSKVSETSKVPHFALIFIGIMSAIILIVNIKFPKVIELLGCIAILWANLTYLMVVSAMLFRRFRGQWPESPSRSHFKLKKFGWPINMIAVVWSAAMVVNVGWPRPEIYGNDGFSQYCPILLTAIFSIFVIIYVITQNKENRVG